MTEDRMNNRELATFILVGVAVVALLWSRSGREAFSSLVKQLFASKIILFLVIFQVMPLPLELLAQVFLLIVVTLNAVAASDDKFRSVAALTSGILVVATLGLLIYSVAHLVSNWDILEKHSLINELVMPTWLTTVAIPVLYLFAFYMGHESLFLRLSFFNDHRRPSRRARLAIILCLRGVLVDVQEFRGAPAGDAARAQTAKEAVAAVRRFKEGRAMDQAARAAARQTLVGNAGRKGVDENGLLLDRREFAETKDALRWVATCHMGWYRNEHRPDEYRADLLVSRVVSDFLVCGSDNGACRE